MDDRSAEAAAFDSEFPESGKLDRLEPQIVAASDPEVLQTGEGPQHRGDIAEGRAADPLADITEEEGPELGEPIGFGYEPIQIAARRSVGRLLRPHAQHQSLQLLREIAGEELVELGVELFGRVLPVGQGQTKPADGGRVLGNSPVDRDAAPVLDRAQDGAYPFSAAASTTSSSSAGGAGVDLGPTRTNFAA